MLNAEAVLEEYVKYLAKCGWLVWVGDSPWVLEGRRLTPATPPHRTATVRLEDLRQAMRRAGAWIALWNDSWDTPPGPWWWICCDNRQYDLDSLSSNRRSNVRRGLRRCEVRLIEAADFAERGYEVYAAAFERYGSDLEPISREYFKEGVNLWAQYPGRERWGAFVDGRLAAYARCIVVDDVVFASEIKADPALLKSYPNEALWFTLTAHYLKERGMSYVTDGWRVLQHQTNVQDFLQSMGYRRIYCSLRVMMHPLLDLAVRCRAQWWAEMVLMPQWAPGLFGRVKAVTAAHGVARACARDESAHPSGT